MDDNFIETIGLVIFFSYITYLLIHKEWTE